MLKKTTAINALAGRLEDIPPAPITYRIIYRSHRFLYTGEFAKNRSNKELEKAVKWLKDLTASRLVTVVS